ncbi:MAG: NAD(P)-dependent oxidoreductase [Propionibacteriaceae bacterium]|jgi:nucleoside-diphosphate-sugar epimerase|nr:NAD(P)-dependent oxidoreductase [Propionibacteriaceae bacterium]
MSETYLITGVSGLIGSRLASLLTAGSGISEEVRPSPARVVGVTRDPERARCVVGNEVTLVGDLAEWNEPVDYLIHAAAPTASRFFVEHPVATMQAIVAGTRQALEWAREHPVKALACLSSLEVYGVPTQPGKLAEADLGYLDPRDVRSSYPQAKRLAETMCAAYAREFKVPARIVRLSCVVGPPVDEADVRFTAQVVRAMRSGAAVALATPGRSARSHIGLDDAVAAIVAVLRCGADGEAYNAANEAAFCSIREFAETAAALVGAQVAEPGPGSGSGEYLSERAVELDTGKLRALGWAPTQSLEQMLRSAASLV